MANPYLLKEDQIDYMIISNIYWPELKSDEAEVNYPSLVQSCVDNYLVKYASLKKPRKLEVAKSLGTVEIELSFEDGSTRSFTVNPVQVSRPFVLYYLHILV